MVWDPYTKEKTRQIEQVQRRAARYVCNDYCSREEGCVSAMIDQLGWRSLEQRRADIRLVFFYKCFHDLVAVDLSKDLIPKTYDSYHSHLYAYHVPNETKTISLTASFQEQSTSGITSQNRSSSPPA